MPSVSTVDHGGGVLEVRLDEPERFNTLEAVIVQELHDVLGALAPRTDVRVVVLTGAGKHFCAGAHLQGHGTAPGGDGSRAVPDWMSVQEHIATLVTRLRSLRTPVVAAVQGAASGGGFALALASDVRVCADDARFNAAFVKVGLGLRHRGELAAAPADRRLARLRTAAHRPLRGGGGGGADRSGLPAGARADLMDTALEVARAIAAHAPYGSG
ncbi:enoyl-CoA hydratase/isomerase family protein [Streptomyces sp. INA 01156]